MTERPILFSAPMVQAILAGRKTQTRRVVKIDAPHLINKITWRDDGWYFDTGNGCYFKIKCPYGVPGDRLWVRESFLPDPPSNHDAWDNHMHTYTSWSGCGGVLTEIPDELRRAEFCIYKATWDGVNLIWRPSIHMPRWASRITLEVVNVRVERLQDITDVDAIDEGILTLTCNAEWMAKHFPALGPATEAAIARGEKPPLGPTPREAYAVLWDSIYGPGAWDRNDWVWVVEFKRVPNS